MTHNIFSNNLFYHITSKLLNDLCLNQMMVEHDKYTKAFFLDIELGNNIQVVLYQEMEHHLSKRLTLNQLAKLLGSSRSSLTRLFYRHFQVTPINYFIHLKMEAAKSMLLSTALQIQEVATRVGYDSPLYFSSEFKKRIGQSPRNFRKKHSGNKI